MALHSETITVTSHGVTPTYVDVTSHVKDAIAASGIATGTCSVISPHTTCAVFFEEYVHDRLPDGAEFLQADLDDALCRLFPDQTEMPPESPYRYPGPEHFAAVETWPDAASYLPGGDRSQLLNADAHLKATLIGSSQVFAVSEGTLAVGPTGYVYFVDFDRSRSRTRRCTIVVMGE
jgi:thiamine phosphate synthase YjbQ (UPF0047 family)